jgi:SAM-dependent methyltransferase
VRQDDHQLAADGDPSAAAPETVTYGTWIRISRLYIFAAIAVVALAGASFALVSAWFALLLVPAALFGYIAVVLALTVWRLGPRGGNFQWRIHDLIVARAAVDPAGRALDIGCGSGALTIGLAKALPTAQVTGVDFWGANWEYSKDQCERNARIEGVAGRTTFVQQSAASLRFDDATFDVVACCLTFHEVRDVTDKLPVIVEALRVLRPGGRYVFLDLFADPGMFGSVQRVQAAIAQAGAGVDEIGRLDAYLTLPFPLGGAKVLGHAMIISGVKPR